MKKTIKILNILFIAVSALLLIIFTISGCEGTGDILNKYIGNTEFFITIRSIIIYFKTPIYNSYLFLLVELVLFIALFSVILYKFDTVYSYPKKFVILIKNVINQGYNDFRYTHLKYIIILPVVVSIFYSYYLPPTADEIVTYNQFVKPSFYKCLIYYPYPNNHILYSFLCNITELIPWMDVLMKMRIITIFTSFIALFIGFRFVKEILTEKLSLLAMGIYSTLFLVLFYSSVARGYSMFLLFFIIASYSAFCIIKKNNQNKHWLLFAFSSVLGFYTMPSFLYPFVSLNLVILLYNYKSISKQLYYNCLIVLVTAILYIPVFMVSGWDMVFSNPDAPSISRSMVIHMMTTLVMWTYSDNFGFNAYYVMIFFMLVGGYTLLRIKKNIKLVILLFIFGVLPFVFPLIQGVFPFSRTFIYISFALTILTVLTFKQLLSRIELKPTLLITLILQISLVCNYIYKVPEYTKGLNGFKAFTETLLEDNKSYFVQAKDDIVLTFDFEAERRSYNCYAIKNRSAEPISADTIFSYDYVLIDQDFDKTVKRKATYSIPTKWNIVNVYVKE
ncbi:glycosyltransferase family 39 protein [Prevotella sp. 10(H)]|uniref:glycosyltransferase family 39 protein n=1 Tax=Prevotella sp. 10(H) TaxID=1158294 RepID=UPI0004A6A962|nr:glycosyltransferase family 39 protein [Prevotella sp. 10(H)]